MKEDINKLKYSLGVLSGLLLGIFIGFVIIALIVPTMIYSINQLIDRNPPKYYIQDVYSWCCYRNPENKTFSPTGENCFQVINEIYNGCY